MLQAFFLLLYLASQMVFYPAGSKAGGGYDPNGLSAPVPAFADPGGGTDPNGRTPRPALADAGGGLDPDGAR